MRDALAGLVGRQRARGPADAEPQVADQGRVDPQADLLGRSCRLVGEAAGRPGGEPSCRGRAAETAGEPGPATDPGDRGGRGRQQGRRAQDGPSLKAARFASRPSDAPRSGILAASKDGTATTRIGTLGVTCVM